MLLDDIDDILVTVIIPTFKGVDVLVPHAIPSVLEQTHSNLQLIVSVHNCVDNTLQAISETFDDPRLTVVESSGFDGLNHPKFHPHLHGGARPRNVAMELAEGAWMCPLDDDDRFTPTHISDLVKFAFYIYFKLVYGNER